MKIRGRILLGFFFIYVISFYFLFDTIVNEIRPRYLETVEDSLNDMVNVLAAMLELEIKNNEVQFEYLEEVFTLAFEREFGAKIYGIQKNRIDIEVYIANRNGIIIYDSDDGKRVGKDYSSWRDVHLTLKGEYGARATRKVKDDPYTSSLYVAAPIKQGDQIIGAITLVKPHDSITPFIELAKQKVIIMGILTCIVFIILSFILTLWIHRPIVSLTSYVSDRLKNKRTKLPNLGTTEIADFGKAFENLWDTLEGKQYIEQYIQSLTHELKSPLTSIHGAAELLNEEMPEEQRKKFYQNILNETQRIENVIQKLLELASIENRKELQDVEEINLLSLVCDVVEGLMPQIERKKLLIQNDVKGDIVIKGEKFLLCQAVRNLLQNAINFSFDNEVVTIYSEISEDSVYLKIKDQGEGIPKYALEKIFERFYSIPSHEGKKKGTGLGLAFVKEVADLHGGSVAIENNTSKGVTASLFLPV